MGIENITLSEDQERTLNELELEVVKWWVVDALRYSVEQKQLEPEVAANQLVLWFPGDKAALTALYTEIYGKPR